MVTLEKRSIVHPKWSIVHPNKSTFGIGSWITADSEFTPNHPQGTHGGGRLAGAASIANGYGSAGGVDLKNRDDTIKKVMKNRENLRKTEEGGELLNATDEWQAVGNPDSFMSCSHGAGRVMSRSQAKKVITLDQHIEAVKGVECRVDESVIDESPAAYKDIDAVMAAQADLVRVRHTLKQVLCVKG